MDKRSSATARVVAATALAVGAIVVIVAVGSALSGGGSSARHGHGPKVHKTAERKRVPATYEVQSGDTLVSIAHSTGVPVRTIEALNPQVDPQILIAGETLKLR
jgi:LysM repeat protein